MRKVMIASVIWLLVGGPAFGADRPLTDQEKTQLAEALKVEGCTGGTMEWEDTKFEVEKAVCADGKTYELEFDQAFKLIKKKLDK